MPIPEKFQRRLAEAAAAFVRKTGASIEDVQAFMADLITIYSDYYDEPPATKDRR